MRIIFFSSFFYPRIGGVESYVANLAKCLAENPQNKVFIVTCNTNNYPAQEVLAKFKVIRLDSWSFFSQRFPIPKPTKRNFNILKDLLRAKPEYFITNVRFYPLTFLAVFIGKFLKTNHVHIEHSAAPLMLGNKFLDFIFSIYDNIFGRLMLFLSGRVTGSSQAAMQFAKTRGARNVARFVAYNGVNPKEFNADSTRSNHQRILFVGRLVYSKGAADLLKAFDIISENFPRAELLIAGNGPELDSLRNQAYNPKIKFLGELDRSQLAAAYKSSSIFVLPSYSESAPTTLLEAGAAGLSIITTKIPGITEIFTQKNNLFKPGDIDALVKILKNNLQNPNLKDSKEFQQKVEQNFDWKVLAQKFDHFLKT